MNEPAKKNSSPASAPQGGAITTAARPTPPIVELRAQLIARRDELKAALGDVPVETFVRAIVTSVQLNPDLLACRFNSLWLACMRACRDGLLPDGVEAALVPYKDTCTYIPMYQGLLRRFRRSGQFKWLTANIVREGEIFTHHIDEHGEHLHHVPGDDTRPMVKAYAVAATKDGGIFIAVLSAAEIAKVRSVSKASREDAPWNAWPEEMWKKTAIRRLSKYLPSARDLMTDDDDEPAAPLVAEAAPRLPVTPQAMLDEFAQPGSPGQQREAQRPSAPGEQAVEAGEGAAA